MVSGDLHLILTVAYKYSERCRFKTNFFLTSFSSTYFIDGALNEVRTNQEEGEDMFLSHHEASKNPH